MNGAREQSSKMAIKPEPGNDLVKQENNDGGDRSILSDPEDYLEEDESLDMNLSGGSQKIWLVKLPRYLAEKWSKTDELGGKQLGTVKIKQGKNGGQNKKLQVKLVLNEESIQNDTTIPKEYDLSVLNTQVKNSYVFSEENLKKFKQEYTELSEMPDQPELPDFDKQEYPEERVDSYRFYNVQKSVDGQLVKKQIPFVKTIPKKTKLVGKVVHDCQIIPSRSDVRYNLVISKNKNSIQKYKPRPKVTLLEDIPGVIQSNAGPSLRGSNTSLFLKSTTNRNKAEGRAIRMPKKDLLDLLFRLFEEYEYWSMKGLKERTRQPESYLKESLESIANLIKKGPYTSKYNLKPEYKKLRDAERAARLGLVNNEGDANEEDEDDDVEMEDVV